MVEVQEFVTVRLPCVLGRRLFGVDLGRTVDSRPRSLVRM